MKKFLAMFIAVVMLLGVSACGQVSDDTASSPPESGAPATDGATSETTFGIEPLPERTTIDLAYFSGAEHGLVFYIMDEMGWADELNIEFNWQYFSAGPAMMEASGSWDVGTAGAAGAINGIVGYDVNVIGISQYEHILGCFIREGSDIYNAGQGNVAEYLRRRRVSEGQYLAAPAWHHGPADPGALP